VYYRAFWQRRCCAAAAGVVLKPLGGNYAVLPKGRFTHILPGMVHFLLSWSCWDFGEEMLSFGAVRVSRERNSLYQGMFIFFSYLIYFVENGLDRSSVL
jgi:hypothetical protein